MSITVEFLGPINHQNLTLDVGSLQELAIELSKYEDIQKWLDKSAIAVNDKITNNQNLALNDNDKVSILPPVCGG